MIPKKFVQIFMINISIEEFSRKAALDELRKVIKEIEEGVSDCSAHPARIEPYLPYTYFSCRENKQEIWTESWFDEYSREEKDLMIITNGVEDAEP